MKGYELFERYFNGLSEKQKEKALGNIFDVEFVSLAFVSFRKGIFDKLLIRMFSNGIFYQYLFVFGMGSDKVFILEKSKKLVSYVIFTECYSFLDDNVNLDEYPFFSFVKILLTDDYCTFCHLFDSMIL